MCKKAFLCWQWPTIALLLWQLFLEPGSAAQDGLKGCDNTSSRDSRDSGVLNTASQLTSAHDDDGGDDDVCLDVTLMSLSLSLVALGKVWLVVLTPLPSPPLVIDQLRPH